MRFIIKPNRYWVFIFIFLLIGSILPSLYLIVIDQSDSMWHKMVDPADIYEGLIYTSLASLILVIVAWFFKPNRACNVSQNVSPLANVISICFYLGFIGLFINIGLNVLFGMSQSNLTAQRPGYAVFAGYLNTVFILCGAAFFYQELRSRGFSGRAFFYLLLNFVALASSWSRFAIIEMIFMVSLAFAYSGANLISRTKKQKNLVAVAVMTPFAVISAYFGQMLRGGEEVSLGSLLFQGFERLFDNNVALYLAIDNFEKMKSILLDGEPRVVIDQMFSFFRERTLYPSSMRFVELSGVVISDERGHIPGYAYGWLGLTYGIAGFIGGLFLLSLILSFNFWGLRFCFSKSNSLMAMLFFAVFANSLMEFPFNLGIDSYVEKIFKNSLYAILAYFIVSFLSATLMNTSSMYRRKIPVTLKPTDI